VIVIDASSLAKYLLRERGWESVERYLVKDVCSIDLVIKEVANAIWKHAVIRHILSTDQAFQVYNALIKLVNEVIVIERQDKYVNKAMEISLSYGITIYDSLYIAQALRYKELLTSDKTQADVAKELGIHVYYVR